MKKTIMAVLMIFLMSAVSCGKVVERVDDSEINMNTEASFHAEEITTEPTEETTEPPTEPYTVITEMPEYYLLSDSYVINGFQTVLQKPELPTGCEITSLTQTLNFYGFDADKEFLARYYMPTDYNGYYTMNDVYLGDPKSNNGFGCNAPVIKSVADNYFESIGSEWFAMDLTGISLQEVLYLVENDRPVIVWSTIDQIESHATFQFVLGCGEDFYFNGYQHCLTVYGFDYNSGTVHVADPLAGNVEYDMARFERIYNEMGNQAVIICGFDETAGKRYADEDEQKKWIEQNKPYKPENLTELIIEEEKETEEKED